MSWIRISMKRSTRMSCLQLKYTTMKYPQIIKSEIKDRVQLGWRRNRLVRAQKRITKLSKYQNKLMESSHYFRVWTNISIKVPVNKRNQTRQKTHLRWRKIWLNHQFKRFRSCQKMRTIINSTKILHMIEMNCSNRNKKMIVKLDLPSEPWKQWIAPHIWSELMDIQLNSHQIEGS